MISYWENLQFRGQSDLNPNGPCADALHCGKCFITKTAEGHICDGQTNHSVLK